MVRLGLDQLLMGGDEDVPDPAPPSNVNRTQHPDEGKEPKEDSGPPRKRAKKVPAKRAPAKAKAPPRKRKPPKRDPRPEEESDVEEEEPPWDDLTDAEEEAEHVKRAAKDPGSQMTAAEVQAYLKSLARATRDANMELRDEMKTLLEKKLDSQRRVQARQARAVAQAADVEQGTGSKRPAWRWS